MKSLLATILLCAPLMAQTNDNPPEPTTPPRVIYIDIDEVIRGDNGNGGRVSVAHLGSRGKIKVTYTGRMARTGPGIIEGGTIISATNQKAGGAEKIAVDGEITVDQQRDNASVYVTGNKGTINNSGDRVIFHAGGTDTTITDTGHTNTYDLQSGSSGVVNAQQSSGGNTYTIRGRWVINT